MRSLFRTQLITIISLILLLLVPNFGLAASLSQLAKQDESYEMSQDQVQAGTNLVPVYYGLRPNNEITPELPAETKADQIAPCTKKFVPNRWSILGKIGVWQWTDVGRWKTDDVGKALQAIGPVEFRIWIGFGGSGTHSIDFEFNWIRNDDIIARAEVSNVQVTGDMIPSAVSANAGLVNQTPFQPNDVFSVYIRCRVDFDGAHVLYGSRAHNSAVVMRSDPLELTEIHGCDEKIKGYYTDAFQVKPNTMGFVAKIDSVELQSVPKMDYENKDGINYRTITWGVDLEPGNYLIEIGISYMGEDNTTIVLMMQEIEIKKKPEPTLFGLPLWLAYLIIIITALIILAIVAKKIYNHRLEKQWLKQMDGQ